MKDWKALIIDPATNLKQAIKILDDGGQRIILIADKDNRLLGTITDGDIRRALIKRFPMTTKATKVMCAEPKKAYSYWDKRQTLATMEKHQLLQLPVVNNNNQIIGLQTLQNLLKNNHGNHSVFLMAGGFGSRLYPLTKNCPKPLLKIKNKPILEIIIERLVAHGFHRFYISTHYMHQMIEKYFGKGEKWGVTIEYVYEEIPLGTAGALRLLPKEEITTPLLMMNADLLTNLNFDNLFNFHYEQQAFATMAVREHEYRVPYGVVKTREHRLLSLVEKPTYNFFINAGIYLLSPNLIHDYKATMPLDMPSLLEHYRLQNKDIHVFPIHEYWLDIGKIEDFRLAQEEYAL